MSPPEERRKVMADPLEPGSISVLQSYRLKQLLGQNTPTEHLTFAEAERLIRLHDPNAAWRLGLATPSQQRFMRRYGLWRDGLTRGAASALIGEIKGRERRP
jgi:hypothetical protein